jgi:hypothetical protein
MKALLIALTSCAFALTSIVSAQTQNETEWKVLVENKPENGQINLAQAEVIFDRIFSSLTITAGEITIIQSISKLKNEDEKIAIRQLASSNKSGTGIDYSKALVKIWDVDPTGWTQSMVNLRTENALILSLKPNAPENLKTMVFEKIKNKPCFMPYYRSAFKNQRNKMSKEQQIELTAQQKELTLSMSNRTPAANAWLAEMSADLIALQLDQ